MQRHGTGFMCACASVCERLFKRSVCPERERESVCVCAREYWCLRAFMRVLCVCVYACVRAHVFVCVHAYLPVRARHVCLHMRASRRRCECG